MPADTRMGARDSGRGSFGGEAEHLGGTGAGERRPRGHWARPGSRRFAAGHSPHPVNGLAGFAGRETEKARKLSSTSSPQFDAQWAGFWGGNTSRMPAHAHLAASAPDHVDTLVSTRPVGS